MRKFLYILPLALLLVTSCKKEIDFDYHSIEKLYVVEGRLTNEGVEVLLTQTRDMEDGERGAGISGAVMTITSTDGVSETLSYDPADGLYRSVNNFTGEAGRVYTMSVSVDGEEFTSHSAMGAASSIESVDFWWQEVLSQKVLVCMLTFRDIPGEENYYCYRMYLNGNRYRWSVLSDKNNDGGQIRVLIPCNYEEEEQEPEEGEEETPDRIMNEGDEIVIELQTIDRRSYDYLSSLGQSAANPVYNFTGGCLGYFSAYSVVRQEQVFSFDNVLGQ